MRDTFLLDPELIFLNHGSFGACPAEVFADYQRWQPELERNPVHFLGRRSGALLALAREVLADYLGARADDLVFLPNATSGVNTVARSLALLPVDEVLAATDHTSRWTWPFSNGTTGRRCGGVATRWPAARVSAWPISTARPPSLRMTASARCAHPRALQRR